MGQFSFRKMMECCTERNSGCWDSGWGEFYRRYNDLIYRFVAKRCYNWKSERLKRQLWDVVDDAVAEVYKILINKLGNYNDFDNEQNFPAWLATICNRAASSVIQQFLKELFIDGELDDLQHYIRAFEMDAQFELYEQLVSELRSFQKGHKPNIERDINIFYLYAWADLPGPAVLLHPCLQDIEKEHLIEVVVSRMRNSLKAKHSFVEGR